MKVLIIGAGFSNWLARLPIGKKITEVFLQADTNFLKCALENILYTDPNNRYVGVQVRDRNPEDIWSDINYFSNHRIPLSVPAYNKLDNNIKNPKLKEYLNFITNNTEIIKGKPEIFFMCAEWEIKDIIRKEMSKKIDQIDNSREKIDTILNKIKFNQKGDSIISFNYDTLIEQTLGLEKCYYPGLNKKTKTQYIPILKPHGSINWLNDGRKIVPQERPYLEETEIGVKESDFNDIWIVGLMESKETTIFNETLVPGNYNLANYLKIAEQIERVLIDADNIIILGYSLQVNDKHIRRLFHKVKKIRKKRYLKELIWVVNEDNGKENEYKKKAREHFLIKEDITPELGGIKAWLLKTP